MAENTSPKSNPAKKTGVPASAPRLTMKQLHTEHVNLADAHRITVDKVDNVQKQVNGQRHLIGELQRQATGNTRANAKAAQMERTLIQIESELAALRKRSGDINTDEKDEVIAGAYNQEFERINARLTGFFNTLNGQDTTLREELEALTGRVGAAEGEITLLRHDHNELHERFNVFAQLRDAVPWGRIVIALVVGVAVAWWTYFFVLGQHTLQDGTVVNLPIVWFVTILVGLGVFGIVLGILHWIRSRNQQEVQQPQNVQVVRTVPINPNPVVNTSAPAADTAPTRVMTTQGAESGAR